jgi:hypothetical protein
VVPHDDLVGIAALAAPEGEQYQVLAQRSMQRRAEQHLYQGVDDPGQHFGRLCSLYRRSIVAARRDQRSRYLR